MTHNTAAVTSNTITQKPPTVVTDSRSTREPLAPSVAAAEASARPARSGGRPAATVGADAGAESLARPRLLTDSLEVPAVHIDSDHTQQNVCLRHGYSMIKP